MIKALKVTIAGESEIVDLSESESTLKGMYEAIGCTLVDRIALDHNVTMWIDDEGMYNRENQENPLSGANWFGANMIALFMGAVVNQPIYGTVLFTESDKFGNTTSLSEKNLEVLHGLAKRLKAWYDKRGFDFGKT